MHVRTLPIATASYRAHSFTDLAAERWMGQQRGHHRPVRLHLALRSHS